MVVNFLMVSLFVFLLLGFSLVLSYFESRPEATAFLKDGVSQAIINNTISELKGYSGVREVKFVSKEDALKIYQQENKDDPLLLEMVTAEILPASIELSADNPLILQDVAQKMKDRKDIFDDVIFQKDVLDSLAKWTNLVRNIGLSIIVFLTIVSAFVISMIIGMKITLRKGEIETLRLLGASNFYIQWPFLMEGMFYGIFGAILGWGVSFGAVAYFRPKITSFFGDIPFWPTTITPFLILLVLELTAGLLIGLLASGVAVKRYFRR